MLAKDSEFSWTTACKQAFEALKEKLVHTPFLRGPNWSLPFHLSSDASDTTIGTTLGQEENQQSYAIYFISKNLSPVQLNYIVTEKDFLAVIFANNKFRHYITGYEVFVHTYHSAIRYLMNKPLTSGRVARWYFCYRNLILLLLVDQENLML